ncbi:family 43 glycosylhydrolase [Ruminiclostridium herbifermentans]|uniref:cellulase n=1 Tax=Ruminiclostridium herbifermentans TaxID=2488810 RepID=A0A4U7JIY1_9FIRM|nr:family 43 glycosylhydrolase [Ruminiclostridium herbifermentans]QNU68671.1 family 43 glycosylhydrolase [Ruminiclostridium herbifermentans]
MFKKRILSYFLIAVFIVELFSFLPEGKANADASLMLWYKFNEGTGTKVTDSSGNGRDGILYGNYSWIAAQNGSGAISLDGNSGYIRMPNGLLSGLTETTVSARIFVDPANITPSWIFTFGTTIDSKKDVNAHYFGFLLEPNVYRVMLAREHWSDEQNTRVSSAFSTGVWKYVTYTQKGTTGILYVDGVKVASNENVKYAPKDIESTVENFIGRAPYLEDKYFNGKVADFRLYNRALSQSEVVDISNILSADIVAMDKAELDLGDLSSVISKITLPTAGVNGSTITWQSSDTSIISTTGNVTRPKYPDTDKQVTLTATIARGNVKDTKVFNVTVKAILPGEDPIIELAKRQLSIPNANDIRGNITLPKSIVVDGVAVNLTWTTDRPDIVNVNEIINSGYDNTPAGVVTRPSQDTKVKLTAQLSRGTATGTTDLTITVKAKPKPISESDYKAYFFTYFTGTNRPDAEQIYFASSKDGLHWNELNNNNPVLTSTVGDKGVRDPYILRSPEGDKFYMVATDLRIANGKGWDHAGTYGSKSVVVWESNDLVNWSKERLVKVSRDDAGCTWAPEIVYDDKTGEYVMFWASRIGADNFSKFRIYIAKTRDFYTFTEPKLYIDRSNDVIDTTIIKHEGIYYRFSKDEVNKNIIIDKCDQLLNKNFVYLQSTSVESQRGVEGPAIFKFNGQNKWCLLLDYYGGSGYYPMVSTDISSGVFTKLNSSEYKLPTGPRHGTVMPITQAEYNAVMAKWGGMTFEEPQQKPVLEYKFDETKSGNAIADTSGNNRTGTLSGNATYVRDSEKNSQVLYLDGTTNTFAAFPQGFFDGRDTVTISMDIKPITVSGNFFTFTVGKDTNKYMFLRTRDTESRNAITINSFQNEQEVKATTAAIANKWMNIKLVITPTSMAIYKDGLMLGRNNNVSLSMSDLGTGLLAYLGKSFYSGDSYFKGYFDNVRVYNRALTETEIAKEFGIPNEPVKIISAEDVILKKEAGQLPELPSKVNVTYSNGTTGSAKVTWDAMVEPALNPSTGTITVEGTLYDNEYNNPLILNRADPCIYKHTDGYYYFTASYTDGSNGHNNVGMYQYDRIVLRRATTIQGLATAEEKVIYTKAPLGGNKSPHVWAPEIHFIDGNWYIYYTTTISSTDVWAIRPHVLMCPGNLDPMVKSNWQDKGLVKKTNSSDMAFTGFSLDETVFEHNGKLYMIWAQNDPNSNLYIARMKDPYTIETNAVKIAEPTYDWELHAYKVNEGPSVIKRNGKIFVAYSASGTDALYCIGLLTASDTSDLLNPKSWVKTPYPVMTLNTEAGQYGPGHNTFTVSEDGSEDILVYHARQEEKYISGSYEPLYDAGRHTRVQKLFWNSDGTPNFGSPFADGKVKSEVRVKATIIVNAANDDIVGDYNGDKAVDSIDFALLKQYLLGMRDSFDVKDVMYVGDLNRDGEINAIDLAILKGYLLGVYDKLPYER